MSLEEQGVVPLNSRVIPQQFLVFLDLFNAAVINMVALPQSPGCSFYSLALMSMSITGESMNVKMCHIRVTSFLFSFIILSFPEWGCFVEVYLLLIQGSIIW